MRFRFTDNKDGTITDNTTNLMWQKKGEAITRKWEEAKDYSKTITLAEHNDWRLPTIEELISIVNYRKYTPSIHPIFDCVSGCYWSDSTYASSNGFAWYVNFAIGVVDRFSKFNDYYVRYVRTIEVSEEHHGRNRDS